MRRAWLPLAVVCASSVAAAAACGEDDNRAVTAPAADAGASEAGGGDGGKPGPCVDGQSRDGKYPSGPTSVAVGKTIPNLSFDGTTSDGVTAASFELAQWFEPCAPKSRLLVLRVSGSWCGTCQWHLSNTKLVIPSELAPRLADEYLRVKSSGRL